MAYFNSDFGNYGYIEVASGQTISGSFQGIKNPYSVNADVDVTNRQGDSSTNSVLIPTDLLITQSTSVTVNTGAVLVYLNAPNYSIS